MGDLIKTTKEFAAEMERYIKLQRAAEQAAIDAKAKYDKLKSFLELSDENRIAAMPGNRFKAADGTVVEWKRGSAALGRLPEVTENDVVEKLKAEDSLAKYVYETYDAAGIKAELPYNPNGEQNEMLAELGLTYKAPAYKLEIAKKKTTRK